MDNTFELLGGLKGKIINGLAARSRLTAKELYFYLVRHNVRVSYQGVHKTLRELEKAGVVVRAGGRYTLSLEWIHALVGYSRDLELAGEKESIFISGKKLLSTATAGLSLLSRFILDGDLKLKDHTWLLFNSRVSLIPTACLVFLSNGSRQKRQTNLVYGSAKQTGYLWCKNLVESKKFHISETARFISHAGEIFSFAGWSSIYVKSFDYENKEIVLYIRDSCEAKEHLSKFGASAVPVCDFTRGLFAGGFSIPLRCPTFDFIEVKCRAKGDHICVVVGKPREKFSLPKQLIASQLGKRNRVDLSFLKNHT